MHGDCMHGDYMHVDCMHVDCIHALCLGDRQAAASANATARADCRVLDFMGVTNAHLHGRDVVLRPIITPP